MIFFMHVIGPKVGLAMNVSYSSWLLDVTNLKRSDSQ